MTHAGSIRRVRQRGAGLSAERLDRLILDALTDATVPLSAYDLLDSLDGSAPRYPTSIYRALERLCANGPVERVETLSCYRLRDKPDAVLFICRKCGKVLAETAAAEQNAIRSSIERSGYVIERLVIEVVGRCPSCVVIDASTE